MADFDCAVVGAGVIGVATANLLAQAGKRVVVIERRTAAGMETSSRNSGVVHASLYYSPGSLKARACTEGRRLLYERCEKYGVPFRKTGKLVVATNEAELAQLETIAERARMNDAGDVRLVDGKEAGSLEPHVRSMGALLSPETGIVDVHELIYCHKKEAVDRGAQFAFSTHVEGLTRRPIGWSLSCVDPSGGRFSVSADVVVNAAGLFAPDLAELVGIDVRASGLGYHLCKGDYFTLPAKYRNKVSRLIYPVPAGAGLGIHLTLDLGGQVTAGPDATYVDSLDYDIAEEKRFSFAEAIARYLPGITADDLTPAYGGIRPKLQGPGDAFRDFVLEEMTARGAPRLISLIGIESPGITASEALAQRVVELVRAL